MSCHFGPKFYKPFRFELPDEREQLPQQSGNLSPNLPPATPPVFPSDTPEPHEMTKIGTKYILMNRIDGTTLRRCVHIDSQREFVCRVVGRESYVEAVSGHYRVDNHPHVNQVTEVVVGKSNSYVVFERSYGDLHTHVRLKRNLREREEAMPLFRQVASAVSACHRAGVVIRDLKLRKFVFKDAEQTQLKLESLDDAIVLDDGDDWLSEKHGCPAYVSPEILTPDSAYSGRAADCWSLGVILFTMLAGRYPFHDPDPAGLFLKIKRGCFNLPEHLSSRAKCLIRSLMRMNPSERLTAEEILDHPWFRPQSPRLSHPNDQMVPDIIGSEENLYI